jgi:hypothetical protein
MKNILLLFFAFFYATSSVAQLLECPVTLNSNGVQPPAAIFNRTVPISNPTDKYVFSVKFHIVKNDDGSGVTAAYGENEVMNAIMIMNTNFNQFNIFFKYVGYDIIKNTSFMKVRAANFPNTNLSHPTFNQLIEYSKTGMTNPVYDYNAMNLFIVEGLDYNVLSPYNTMVNAAAKMPGIDSVYGYNHFLSSTLLHEIAHNFFLLHTYEQSGTPNCEHVAENGTINYNSNTHGDRVEDTKASFLWGGNYVNLSNCTFQNPTNHKDCLLTPYVDVPVRNYMDSKNPCQNLGANYMPGTGEFTPGQGSVMRNTIALYYNHPNNLYGLSNAKNTVESLYEPYEITPILGEIVSITDDGIPNGMSTVCRRLTGQNYKYQKGFNYIFNRYGLVTNEQPYQLPNYQDYGRFMITQLNPTYRHPFGYVCYRDTNLCKLEPISGGKIYTTQNLGSTNISETNLTSQQIENQNLIENLPNQTFNIIVKETPTGETKAETIYKP